MNILRHPTCRLGGLIAAILALGVLGTASATTAQSAKARTSSTITVIMHYPSPPKYMLNEFTKQTGIKVNWETLGFADEQTKIAAAGEAGAYFADATDVDWSAIGEYAKTGWFIPLNKYFNEAALKKDMPQISSFVAPNGQLLGVPFDSEYITPTINTRDFAHAGIKGTPTTLAEFTADLKTLQKSGFAHPLDIPFAAAAGEAQCWFQVAEDFGGSVVSKTFAPEFTSPSSPGYQALKWMINAYKSGLVPAANINMIDLGALTTEMAHNRVAAAICDYSGDVGSIYDVSSISSVVNQIAYISDPGVKGPVPGLANMDGIGIPTTAHNVAGAVEFLKWFNSTENQAIWSGLDGAKGIIAGIPLPTRISSLQLLAAKKVLSESQERALVAGLEDSLPIFPGKAPAGYIPFYTTVYDTIHSAAAGQLTLQQAVTTIANAARRISG